MTELSYINVRITPEIVNGLSAEGFAGRDVILNCVNALREIDGVQGSRLAERHDTFDVLLQVLFETSAADNVKAVLSQFITGHEWVVNLYDSGGFIVADQLTVD